MAVFDEDGAGPLPPALLVCGSFTTAGGQPVASMARWNGVTWSGVGGGISGTIVRSLKVFDEDGDGPNPAALFACGSFTSAGGTPTANVARWNGSAWSSVGSGLASSDNGIICLAEVDFGQGPRLVAGGDANICKGWGAAVWDGLTWEGLPGKGDNVVRAVCGVPQSGAGDVAPGLYLGGNFNRMNGYTFYKFCHWTESGWASLSSGLNQYADRVTVLDAGDGPHA